MRRSPAWTMEDGSPFLRSNTMNHLCNGPNEARVCSVIRVKNPLRFCFDSRAWFANAEHVTTLLQPNAMATEVPCKGARATSLTSGSE